MKWEICLLVCFVAGTLADGEKEEDGPGLGAGMDPTSRNNSGEREGWKGKGGRKGKGGKRGPSFMRDLPEEVQQQFKDIMHDDKISPEEKQQKSLQLAQTVLEGEQLVEFEKFSEKMAQRQKEKEELLAALSPNARAAADKMKTIWRNKELSYDERKQQKEDILNTLSDSEKEELEKIKSHHRGGRHRGGGRRGGHRRHHHHKEFMRDLPEDLRQQFKDIMHDDSISPEERREKSLQLAQTVLKGEQLEEFEKFSEKMVKWEQKRKEQMAALSPNARAAAEKIRGLWRNKDMSRDERKQQKEDIMNTLSDSEKEELEKIKGHRGGRRHHGKSFMRDLPENVRQQFKDIWHDDSLSPEQKQQQSLQLAETVLSVEQLEEFRNHNQRMEERRHKMEEQLAALSPNAKSAAEKMKELWHNRDMTREERKQQKETIMQTLSDSERKELETLRGGRRGFGGRSGKGRGFGGGRSGSSSEESSESQESATESQESPSQSQEDSSKSKNISSEANAGEQGQISRSRQAAAHSRRR